jgi:hypothetical protein
MNNDQAMFAPSLPCNPIPFLTDLADLVREQGTDAIKSDKAKRLLWVVIAQSYGQLACVDLCKEFTRLHEAEAEEVV